MSSPAIDIVIWLLLLTGAGFSVVGVIGLFLFPDIRSRRFTSVRATLIGSSAVIFAAIVYGIYQIKATGASQYTPLVLHVLFLLVVVSSANYVISREIMDKAIPKSYCQVPDPAE
jgi:multisubunit Na+/H+ antiporter MnhG subunit